MSQKVEITPTEEELKKVVKQIATEENVALAEDIFKLLLDAWLSAADKDKRLIQILIMIIAGILTFLAAGRALTG